MSLEMSPFTLSSGGMYLSISKLSGKILGICVKTAGDECIPLLVEPPADAAPELVPGVNAQFTIQHAWGLDECYPSVSPYREFGLRDHGWVWGTPGETSIRQNWAMTEWKITERNVFRRDIVALAPCDGAIGRFAFTLTFPTCFPTGFGSASSAPLYAAHALLSAEEGDVLQIWDGVDSESSRRLIWEKEFPSPDTPVVHKTFFTGKEKLFARLVRKRLRLEVLFQCEPGLPYLGIWWCNDAWGDGRPYRSVGIEPTNHHSDGPVLQHFLPPSGSIPQTSAEYTVEVRWLREGL
jgi:hypothetical protein